LPEEPSKLTVYFDGSCPLCSAEIGHYERLNAKNAVCFVDISAAAAPLPDGLSKDQAMARFHVGAADGSLVSGAAAFVRLWAALPGWRWAARFARLPGITPVLEWGYRRFLPLRPFLARLVDRRPAQP
jgi:predicted DCC family thiol-disulfide oxidoreductase YuxK